MGRTVSGEGTPRYRCSLGASDKSHSRPYIVPERALMPAVRDDAARLRVPYDLVEMADRDDTRRAALEAKRERWIEQYGEGLIDKPTRDARLADIREQIGAMDAAKALRDIPPAIDWSWTPEELNAVLRALGARGARPGPDAGAVRVDGPGVAGLTAEARAILHGQPAAKTATCYGCTELLATRGATVRLAPRLVPRPERERSSGLPRFGLPRRAGQPYGAARRGLPRRWIHSRHRQSGRDLRQLPRAIAFDARGSRARARSRGRAVRFVVPVLHPA